MFELEFIRQIRNVEGINTWIQIMSWVFVLSWAWILVLLLRGGFTDILEIAASRYATSRERFDASLKLPFRALALIAASFVGAFGFALGVFTQGALLIFAYQQFASG